MRLMAIQTWPAARSIELVIRLIACSSRIASPRTSAGSLPPSSINTFLTLPAASSRIRRPVSVLPVNAMARTRGSFASVSPTTDPWPVTTLSTPGGKCGLIIRAHSMTVSGQYEAGLTTTVLPVASAGTNRLKLSSTGEFHGDITAVTPLGRFRAQTGCFFFNESRLGPLGQIRRNDLHQFNGALNIALGLADGLTVFPD